MPAMTTTRLSRHACTLIIVLAAPGGLGCDSGGSSGGGHAGSGGSGAGGAPGGDSLIDDMEDKDGSILGIEGRQGAWYTYNDETAGGTQAPEVGKDFAMATLAPPRGDSTAAANTSGEGFTDWGAGVGFDLDNTGTTKATYDASAFSGIKLYAKIGPGSSKSLRINVVDKQTAPEGGICKEADAECFDDFGAGVALTEEWKEITLAFADLTQQGFGKKFDAVDASALYAIHFQVDAGSKFDLWIDDVSFTNE
jgi:hypothetical protein